MATTSNVSLLATLWKDFTTTKCRFLVDQRRIKYADVDNDLFGSDWHFEKNKFRREFPPFPVGDWNYCQIRKSTINGLPTISGLESREFTPINADTVWHHENFEFLDFPKIKNLSGFETHKEDKTWIVLHPVSKERVVMKIAQFPEELPGIERELIAYRRLDGRGITPKFLGNVVESGQVVGFITEYIDEARHPDITHLDKCRDILRQLRESRIVHGDAHRENFIIKGGQVYVVDFEKAKFDDATTAAAFLVDAEVLQQTMEKHEEEYGSSQPEISIF